MTCTSSQGQPLYPQESHQTAIIPLGLLSRCCCSYRVVPIGRTDGWIGGHDMWRHFVYFNAAYKLDPFIKINQNALRGRAEGFNCVQGLCIWAIGNKSGSNLSVSNENSTKGGPAGRVGGWRAAETIGTRFYFTHSVQLVPWYLCWAFLPSRASGRLEIESKGRETFPPPPLPLAAPKVKTNSQRAVRGGSGLNDTCEDISLRQTSTGTEKSFLMDSMWKFPQFNSFPLIAQVQVSSLSPRLQPNMSTADALRTWIHTNTKSGLFKW